MDRGKRDRGAWASVRVFLWFGALLALIGIGAPGCSDEGKARANGGADAGPTGDSPLANKCTDAQCAAEGTQCDPFRGCVPCLLETHCPAGSRCFDRACEAAIPCATNDDCRAYPQFPACAPAVKQCVRCAADGDCAGTAHCIASSCVPYTACVNSFDCPDGKVCDRDLGECVQCFQHGDCNVEAAELCVRNRCTPSCLSDNDCRALNKLCETEGLFCASCIRHEDCPNAYHCAGNECAIDVCLAKTTRCSDDRQTLSTCLPAGEGITTAPCGAGRSCATDGLARCEPWKCTPNTAACDAEGKNVVQCSTDGLSTTVTAACEPEGKVCRQGVCVVLACTPGATFCASDGNLAVCSDDGTTSVTTRTCLPTEYCDVATLGCLPMICTPGAAMCDGQRQTVCLPNGSGPSPEGTDCSATGAVCEDGACKPLICTAGGRVCNAEGNVETCNSTGTAFTVHECIAGQYCGDGFDGPACLLQSCTPGAPICSAGQAGLCNALGNGITDPVDCATQGAACVNGACLPIICQGTRECIGGAIHTCINQGTATSFYASCTSGQHCVKNGSSAICLSNLCTPGAAACNGSVLTQCNAVGDDFEPGGTDCTATGAVCLNGACLPVICNGTRDCIGRAVHTCTNQGTTSTVYATCPSAQHCQKSGTSAACVNDTCTPGAPACNGDLLTTCNTDGSGYTPGGTDCTATGGVCYGTSPQCLPKICEPNAIYCKNGDGKNGDLYRCGQYGATESLYTTCGQSQYCSQSGTSATCRTDLCTENQLGCDGARVATCNADGSGFLAGGTDCAAQPGTKNCRAGACYDVICTANAPYCVATTLTRCDATGTTGTTIQDCSGSSYCDSGNATVPAACVPDFCSPGAAACSGERTTTCGTDGGSYAPGGTDCSTSNQVCDIGSGTAQCASEALDTVATAATTLSASNTLFLNAYAVRTSRSLTEIRQSMMLVTGTSIVTWVVYERIGSTGLYAKLFEQAVPTPGDGTMKLQSSGTIDVTLQAGREYLIGFWGSTTVGIDSNLSSLRYYPSFGPFLGRARITANSVPSNPSAVAMSFAGGHHQVLETAP